MWGTGADLWRCRLKNNLLCVTELLNLTGPPGRGSANRTIQIISKIPNFALVPASLACTVCAQSPLAH